MVPHPRSACGAASVHWPERVLLRVFKGVSRYECFFGLRVHPVGSAHACEGCSFKPNCSRGVSTPRSSSLPVTLTWRLPSRRCVAVRSITSKSRYTASSCWIASMRPCHAAASATISLATTGARSAFVCNYASVCSRLSRVFCPCGGSTWIWPVGRSAALSMACRPASPS